MTAYTAIPNDCNHNCRKERCDSVVEEDGEGRLKEVQRPSLVEQIKAAVMEVQGRDNVTAPCEIKAIRATAGNRLVTVDNSAGWRDLMQDLTANGVQFVSDNVKTIPGTEEALNEFYDAIANNQGDFNGYLGWGGASLQIALKN